MGDTTTAAIEIHPLVPERWPDLAQLFGPRGADEGCWCMYFRQTSQEFSANRGSRNREAFRGIVEGGEVPGLLAYVDGAPAGWCSAAPRETYPRIRRSPITRPVDDQPAWSVVCFFIGAEFRGLGVAQALLKAAVDYAVAHGAKVIEGYPVDPSAKRLPDSSGYHGFVSAFAAAGFKEVLRRKETRPIMRYYA